MSAAAILLAILAAGLAAALGDRLRRPALVPVPVRTRPDPTPTDRTH